MVDRRDATGGTLVVGGGFAGASVARALRKRGVTIVNPDSTMVYTPLLPEAAAGTLEPRHGSFPCGRCARTPSSSSDGSSHTTPPAAR